MNEMKRNYTSANYYLIRKNTALRTKTKTTKQKLKTEKKVEKPRVDLKF